MKKKVNVNRKKISSEEISTHKNFSSLIKNYPRIINPFHKTSWRTKGLIWVAIIIIILIYYIISQEG